MKILLTGVAGFIGAAVAKKLIESGYDVVGIDNINDYYDPNLKLARLRNLGIEDSCPQMHVSLKSKDTPSFNFIKADITDNEYMAELFASGKFDAVVHLAAQPGVRYSMQNPHAYIDNNIRGFLNILEGCRINGVKHLVYASSSSVYGLNGKVPFSETDSTQHPISLYAATKKSNEMMAHAYSFVYNLPVTGLRFFTVYGPWGRPDMSTFLFLERILDDKPIRIFNNGNLLRDFTFIDDIAEGVVRIINKIPEGKKDWDSSIPDPSSSQAPFKIYNIGNQRPIKLMDYIKAIEKETGIEAKKEYLPAQPGDVYQTYADSSALAEVTDFSPSTSLEEGISKTVAWFKEYYGRKHHNS